MDILKTNTILAAIPQDMTLARAKAAFQQFGEIEGINMIPAGPTPAVSVTYFDVLSASAAMYSLGGIKYCRPGPQKGDRTVRLSGDFRLSQEDIHKVCKLTEDETGESFTIEFFDVRDAERVRQASKESTAKADTFEMPPGLEHIAKLRGAAQLEAAESNGLKDVTNVPLATRSSFTVCVANLPEAICQKEWFEAMLQQGGLQGQYVDFSTKPTTGEATIWLRTREAADMCLKHFQGCAWNKGKALTVKLMQDGAQQMKNRSDTGTTLSTEVSVLSDLDAEAAAAGA